MLAIIATIAVALAAVAAIVILYWRELARWAAFLESRPASSNTRLTLGAPLPGCQKMVREVNVQLDEIAHREQTARRDEEELLQGLASLSHDIRTPLAGAKGYLQLAMDEDDDDEGRRCMARAEERLGTMQVMLDQLFDYMRSANPQNQLALEDEDGIAILAAVLAGNFPGFAERGWSPSIDLGDEELSIRANKDALTRIFENIVSNMLKYGAGDIRIARTERALVFSNAVEHDPAIDCEAVFEPFYRGDFARSMPGAGLGLAAVRRLCEQMGIEASARASEGMFSLTLRFPPQNWRCS